METNEKYGVIPPNTALQERVGGPLKPLDDATVGRLEQAMKSLEGEMGDWIKTDMERLITAHRSFLRDGNAGANIVELHRAAHDLRGLGSTYGYPIVTVIADNLCKAMEMTMDKGCVPEDLIKAHVDALRAVVNLDLRDPDRGPAAELVSGLRTLAAKKVQQNDT